MSKMLEIISKITDIVSTDAVYIGIIFLLSFGLYWLEGNNKELKHKLAIANNEVEVFKKAVEQQNADIEKYKADIRKYNEAVVSEVKTIKSRTAVETENVKMELKKDNSDTNQLKLLDKKLMDFSDGK